MHDRTFTSVDDNVLKEVISRAQNRLVFIAPGIRPPVAEALASAMRILPPSAIHIVLDVDAEETFKDPNFRELLAKRFGKPAIDRLLHEHDAAPEQQRPQVAKSEK